MMKVNGILNPLTVDFRWFLILATCKGFMQSTLSTLENLEVGHYKFFRGFVRDCANDEIYLIFLEHMTEDAESYKLQLCDSYVLVILIVLPSWPSI